MMMSIAQYAARPLTRFLAVFLVEFLISQGYLHSEKASQYVEDIASVIGYVAMAATLLIYQWKSHHTEKTVTKKETIVEEVKKEEPTTHVHIP